MLIRQSSPAGLAVSVDEAKLHARVETDDSTEDDLIEDYIRAAQAFVAEHTGRVLVPTSLEYQTGGWSPQIEVPAAPLRSVTEIAYLDADHAEQTLDAGDYYVTMTPAGFDIGFTDAFASPVLSDRPNPVMVRFDAGYDDPAQSGSGDDPELAPDPRDKQIVYALVAHWYESREAVTPGALSDVPFAAKAMMAQRRIFR